MDMGSFYKSTFEDKWFCVESSSSSEDENEERGPTSPANDSEADKQQRDLRRRHNNANLLRDMAGLNFSQSIEKYAYIILIQFP